MGSLLIDGNNAGGNARAIKKVWRQADDAFDVALADEGAANVGLGAAAKQNPMRQDAGTFARAL
jgi:hypothetical protein